MRRAIPLLLVVDGGDTRGLTSWLQTEGFNAVSVASYLEARAVLGAVQIDGMIGHLALSDGSYFELARMLRAQRPAVVIGYADVDVRPPPELDGCFVRPLDLKVLGSFLGVRFGRRRSGEHPRITSTHSVPAARPASDLAPAISRRRR